MKVGYYILSRKRVDKQHTAKLLDDAKLPYKICVEPQEYDTYCAAFGTEKILSLDQNNQGIAYARNWAKQYSKKHGEDWHWNLDDDIRHVYICVKGKNVKQSAKVVLGRIQLLVGKYDNVALSGLASSAFNRYEKKPVLVNRFCYSFMLVIFEDFAWRHITVADLDYNLQVLTAGHCTMAFKVFSFAFSPQQLVSGGLTDIRTDEVREKWVYQILRDWQYLGLKMKRKKDGSPRVVTGSIWRNFRQKLQWKK